MQLYYYSKTLVACVLAGGTLDILLSTTYCRSQMYLSKQLAQLHPELTMPMFSGKLRRLIKMEHLFFMSQVALSEYDLLTLVESY